MCADWLAIRIYPDDGSRASDGNDYCIGLGDEFGIVSGLVEVLVTALYTTVT